MHKANRAGVASERLEATGQAHRLAFSSTLKRALFEELKQFPASVTDCAARLFCEHYNDKWGVGAAAGGYTVDTRAKQPTISMRRDGRVVDGGGLENH